MRAEVVVVSEREDVSQYSMHVGEEIFEQIDRYGCLAAVVASGGMCIDEIGAGIVMARVAFSKISVLAIGIMPTAMGKRVLKYCVESVLLYTCGAWTVIRQVGRHMVAR